MRKKVEVKNIGKKFLKTSFTFLLVTFFLRTFCNYSITCWKNHWTSFPKSWDQGVSKRCRLSWLTNSALVYEPKCGGERGGVAGSQPMSTVPEFIDPRFRENKPKALVFSHWKRAFWACFHENWVYNFGHSCEINCGHLTPYLTYMVETQPCPVGRCLPTGYLFHLLLLRCGGGGEAATGPRPLWAPIPWPPYRGHHTVHGGRGRGRGGGEENEIARCLLSLLTKSALVYESQCGVSANEYSCVHHVTWSPN
jgi:hypothetical protein